jgi:predicted dehydrogenase
MRLENPNKLELEIDHFLNCIARGEQPLVDGEQGAAALQVAVQISEMVKNTVHAYLDKT